MTIWLDMDGTLGDLYGVPDWLPKLRSFDPSPYAEAKPLQNMSLLARLIHLLQKKGVKFGINSWLAKDAPKSYDTAVTVEKYYWLGDRLASVRFDYIVITKYGVPKSNCMTSPDDVLCDDNKTIRDEWKGKAITPDQLIPFLKELYRKV